METHKRTPLLIALVFAGAVVCVVSWISAQNRKVPSVEWPIISWPTSVWVRETPEVTSTSSGEHGVHQVMGNIPRPLLSPGGPELLIPRVHFTWAGFFGQPGPQVLEVQAGIELQKRERDYLEYELGIVNPEVAAVYRRAVEKGVPVSVDGAVRYDWREIRKSSVIR